jgi:predicted metal-binding membrane protein
MPAVSTLERLLRRDRLVVITALLLVIVACWAYVLAGAGMDMAPLETTPMPGVPGMAETDDAAWRHARDGPERYARDGHAGMGDIPGA